VCNSRITRNRTPAPTLDPAGMEREPEVIIAPTVIHIMPHLNHRRSGTAPSTIHLACDKGAGTWGGGGGADEQGGLGGVPPLMKRGYGGGSPKLDVKCMFENACYCRHIGTLSSRVSVRSDSSHRFASTVTNDCAYTAAAQAEFLRLLQLNATRQKWLSRKC